MSPVRNPELGTFLRTRRARLEPGDVGLPGTGRRRVPGLRREELAQLAGVSPDYYARLEQGRQASASPSVLDAVARTLRLTAEERSHLFTLARAAEFEVPLAEATADVPDSRVTRVLENLGDTPAVVCGPFADILLVNSAARFLFDDFNSMPMHERNAVRWMFLSPKARKLYREEWETSVAELVGMLRFDVGRRPDSPRGAAVVRELSEGSPQFSRLWADHQVSRWLHDRKVLHLPSDGPMEFFNEAITLQRQPGQVIYVMMPGDPAAFTAAFTRSATAR
jgi:transcriptional regulator with XRE-family HTH domain